MGFRFRRRIKLLPGLHLNIGKKGVTGVSLGQRGASVSTGKRGSRVNISTGIPGLTYSTQITGKTGNGTSVARKVAVLVIVGILLMLIWVVRR